VFNSKASGENFTQALNNCYHVHIRPNNCRPSHFVLLLVMPTLKRNIKEHMQLFISFKTFMKVQTEQLVWKFKYTCNIQYIQLSLHKYRAIDDYF